MNNAWKFLMGISIFLSLWIGVLSILSGECGGFIEGAAANVPMKCHWTFLVVSALGFAAAVIGIIGLFMKEKRARIGLGIAVLVVLVVVLLVMYPLIGVCADDTMACVGNRFMVTSVLMPDMLLVLVAVLRADPNKPFLPRPEL